MTIWVSKQITHGTVNRQCLFIWGFFFSWNHSFNLNKGQPVSGQNYGRGRCELVIIFSLCQNGYISIACSITGAEMNKAFVKEDDSRIDSTPEIELDARADIPPGAMNYMTPKGARQLREELEGLLHEERPRLLKLANQDESLESGPLADSIREAKKSLRKTDRRIDFLIQRLELTEIVDPLQVQSDRVRFGASVRVYHQDGSLKDYQIVGIDETDLSMGRISWTSPLAMAILDAAAGDVIPFRTPVHEEEVEIVSVRYEEIL